jgi:uncharacterized protein
MAQLQRFAGSFLALILAGTAAAHEGVAPPRVIAVSGSGEATTKPDRARLTLAVEKLDPDLKKAEAEVNRIVRAYLAEAKMLGAKEEQISTSGASINPEYVWPEGGRERRFTGYRVSRLIEVRIDALDKLGDFILRATAVGVNQVNPPLLESTRENEFERVALARAAEDARDKARVLAETLRVRLGSAYRIVESQVGPQPEMYRAMAARGAVASQSAGAEMGLSLGELTVRATVSVEFELLPP